MTATDAVRRAAALVGLVAAVATGCSGGHDSAPTARPSPNLAGFLALPVATPTACPPGTTGSASGRRSPWAGTVDVSVFFSASATDAQLTSAAQALGGRAIVRDVVVETATQAYEEYRRLYTCGSDVDRRAIPASLRLVLRAHTEAQRDALVRDALGLPGAVSASCDPSDPCVDVVRRSTPAPSPT